MAIINYIFKLNSFSLPMPKLPNFLIVGMAKCGTSSLSQYLSQHPEIFMSTPKEPRFISSQVMQFPMNGPKDNEVEAWYVKDYQHYVDLFKDANRKAIGEASADTLYYYKGTIPIIKELLGDPKIIIILRDPVKRAFSAYQHLCRDNREPLSFEEALLAEDKRINENWELIYYYKNAGLYAKRVKAFMENFSEVLVLLNEDLQTDPESVLKRIFRFLEVDENVMIDYGFQYNQSGIPKRRFVHNFLFKENFVKKAIRPFVHLAVPSREKRTRINSQLLAGNLRKMKIDANIAAILKDIYKNDVSDLQQITGMDLTKWLK